ncbi:MAG: CBS domain-containing protein [Sterolibacterium sp.]
MRLVKDVLEQRKVIQISPTSTVLDAARLMALHRIGALIAFDGKAMIGIVTERDILTRVVATGKDQKTTTVASVMTPDPKTISADKPFVNALIMMRDGDFRHLPVVDGGEVVGMVSIRDAVGAELEEESQLDLG